MAALTARGALASGLLGLGLMIGGCRGASPELPVEGHRELCCKAANPDGVSFEGCRATSYCRASESVWVRGPVSCTPVGEQGCAGERCCKLAVEPEPEPEPEAVVEPAPAGEASEDRAPAPAPAPIEIVPLDWKPGPTRESSAPSEGAE
jgi:hypothetical protein